MVASVLDLIPTEDELDRLLCVREREVQLLRRLLALARTADAMRAADAADRMALPLPLDRSEARRAD